VGCNVRFQSGTLVRLSLSVLATGALIAAAAGGILLAYNHALTDSYWHSNSGNSGKQDADIHQRYCPDSAGPLPRVPPAWPNRADVAAHL
jgi:hypothetical protein